MAWLGSEAQLAACRANLQKALAAWKAKWGPPTPCQDCGGPKLTRKALRCDRCNRIAQKGRPSSKAHREACADYTKDPCSKCGYYPLGINNRTGVCRACQRNGGRLATSSAYKDVA